MYAVVTWEITASTGADAIQAEALACLDGRTICEMHDDVRITTIAGNIDFLELVESLHQVGQNHDPDFTYSIFLLRRNAPLRSNADFDEDCVSGVQSN